MSSTVQIPLSRSTGGGVEIGRPDLAVISGPCVIESRDHAFRMAESITAVCRELGMSLIFKASYDKANRTSLSGYRGVGREEGLRILSDIREQFSIPVVSDIHLPDEVEAASEALSMLQIPAFLCRQTDMLLAAGGAGLPVMIKKGQFVHPADMQFAVEKVRSAGCSSVLLCERGSMFGYRELIVDFRSFAILSELECPVVFDATHSVQNMSGGVGRSSGSREYVPLLARAAVAAGVDAIFLECHDDPDSAPSDGPNMVPLAGLRALLADLKVLADTPLSTRRAGS